MDSIAESLQDLELIQIVSLGEALSTAHLKTFKYRLKTFGTGSAGKEAA